MIILIVILSVALVFALLYIVFLKVFKKYTRERFAFVGLAVILTLSSTVILQIYSAQGYLQAFCNFSNLVFNTRIESPHADWRDYIITIVIMCLVIYYLIHTHRNWNGPVSIETHEKQRFNRSSTIFEEANAQFLHLIGKKQIEKWLGDEQYVLPNVFQNQDQAKQPWHVNVFELLTYSSDQFNIDLKSDYFDKESCFIGYYGKKENQIIAVLCVNDYPKDSRIREFMTFVRKQHKEVFEYFIAVKSSDRLAGKVHYQGQALTLLTEKSLLDSLVNFKTYFKLTSDRFSYHKVSEGSKFTLNDIYVPLEGETLSGEKMANVEDYVLQWSSEDSNRHLAILADYGCGKSVISLKIACDMIEEIKNGGRIPVLVELRGKSPRTLSENEILATWAQEYHINAAALMKLHKAGRLVIIFEGFDEMDMVGDSEMRLEHFQKLWLFATPKSKIIITGRPNFFLDDAEMRASLGIERGFEQSAYCEGIYLQKLMPSQINAAMRNVDATTRAQVLEIMSQPENENFFDLISRPAILYLVSIIWKERKLSEVKDKINSALIISEFIIYSYSRQSGKMAAFPLNEKEREFFMLGIAVGMVQKSKYTNQISKTDLQHIILQLYRNFPAEISGLPSALSPRKKSLKNRMLDANAEDTIMTDVRSCGILTNDITRRDYFKFAHKSFLEYQLSLYFVESLLQDGGSYNVMMNAISAALEVQVDDFKQSEETMSFTAQILTSKLGSAIGVDDNQKARELFSKLYPLKGLKKLPEFAVFLDLIFGQSMVIFVLTFSMFSAIIVYILLYSNSIAIKVPFYVVAVLIAFNIALLFMAMTLRKAITAATSRNRIWYLTCKELKIDNKVLNNIMPPLYSEYLSIDIPVTFFEYYLARKFKTFTNIRRRKSNKNDL